MGKDIHIRIVKRNRETNNWELVNLYRKDENNEIKKINFYPFRNYDIFDILQEREDLTQLSILPIAMAGLPTELQEEITEDEAEGCYDFKEVTLADLKLYFEYNPQIKDWDAYYEDELDPRNFKTNPIKYFIERIEYFLDFAIDSFWKWNYSNSDIKILYWFDN